MLKRPEIWAFALNRFPTPEKLKIRLTFVLYISRNVLYQEFDNALKVFLECFSLVESAISAPEMAYKMFTRCLQGNDWCFRLKDGLSETPSGRGENVDL